MHVVHVLPYHFTNASLHNMEDLQTRGGAERAFFQLVRAMAVYVRTTAIVFGGARQTLDWQGVRIEMYPAIKQFSRYNGVGSPLSMRFLSQLRSADIIQCYQVHADTTLLTALCAKMLRKPVFVVDYGYRGLNLARLPIVPLLATTTFASSPFALRQYRHARSTSLIWAGVTIEEFPFSAKKDRAVLCVARILPHKGINYLIEALDTTTELTILGRSDQTEYLAHLEKLALGKNVRFLLNASEEVARREYARAMVVVLPSVYRDMYGKWYPRTELFGLALAEGMASGAACIATRVGALPEVVRDGETGFVVPPNDASVLGEHIKYLLDHPEVSLTMGRNGRALVEKMFTWDAVAHRCLLAYSAAGVAQNSPGQV